MKGIAASVCGMFLVAACTANAQVINNSLSYRNISDDHYVRLYYENDLFNKTDYYYTQGLYLEFVLPALQKNPLNRLLIHPKADHNQYGLAIHHEGYTPMDFISDKVQYGDRPFAADLFLKSFIIATDSVKRARITTSLSTGIIGAGAGGGDMQTYIHEHTHNNLPHGWQYQVNNDVVLNYELDYERSLINVPDRLLISGFTSARLGTLSTRASVGLSAMAGIFNDPYHHSGRSGFNIYLYDHPQVEAVGYDATLQGGLFDHNNAYTISAKNINRVVFENRFGIVISWKRIYLEYFERAITQEFNGGKSHASGGLQLGISW